MRLFARILAFTVAIVASPLLPAQSFNIDIGGFPPPPETFGAAAGQTGTWLRLWAGLHSDLTAADGSATTVGLSIEGLDGTTSPGCGDADVENLLSDYNYQPLTDWSVTFLDLANGTYTLYIYGPGTAGVDTGTVTVNGGPVGTVTGDSCTLTAGVTHLSTTVTVTDGTLAIVGAEAQGSHGIAGLQLVQLSAASEPVPALSPAGLVLMALSLAAAALLMMRRFAA